jgi:hypothetical protein
LLPRGSGFAVAGVGVCRLAAAEIVAFNFWFELKLWYDSFQFELGIC